MIRGVAYQGYVQYLIPKSKNHTRNIQAVQNQRIILFRIFLMDNFSNAKLSSLAQGVLSTLAMSFKFPF